MTRTGERTTWIGVVFLLVAYLVYLHLHREGRNEAVNETPVRLRPYEPQQRSGVRIASPVEVKGSLAFEEQAASVDSYIELPPAVLDHLNLQLMRFDSEGINPDLVTALALTKEQSIEIERLILETADKLSAAELTKARLATGPEGEYFEIDSFDEGSIIKQSLISQVNLIVQDEGRRKVLEKLIGANELFANFGSAKQRVYIEMKTLPDGKEYPLIKKEVVEADGTIKTIGQNSWEAAYFNRRYGKIYHKEGL